ncbi:MAG: acetylornithine transaminase, partial [Burkholderiaceae bacterium]
PVKTLMPITPRPSLVFVRGEGTWLWDEHGEPYLDFVQGWAVNSLGHCPPAIREALNQQASRLISPSPAYFNAPAIELAQLLTQHSGFDQAFFASAGAEANEGAIKLARRFGESSGRFEIITFKRSFHGRTLATMSASGKPAFEPLFEPKVPGFAKATLNDIDSVAALINDRTIAVMIEPIQGEGGVQLATTDFLKELRALTFERDLLLVVDEIQTGVGRTGKLWAYEHADITPDIMTLGKGLGGGVPLSALLATERASCFQYGDQGGTYCGNPLMCAVGLAVVNEVMQPAFLAQVQAHGKYLADQLRALSRRHQLGEVRGQGLLLALDLARESANQIVEIARSNGLLINAPTSSLLRFMPPLNVTRDDIDLAISKLDGAIRTAHELT